MAMSAAMVAELRGHKRVYPTLDLTLGGTVYKFASEPVASASAGMYLPYVVEGGWSELSRSVAGRNIALQTPQLTVSVYDEKRAIQKALGGAASGDVYGSAAEVYLRSNHVDAADHYKAVDGIVVNHEMGEERVWTWTLEPDLAALKVENRLPRITVIDFPNAPADSIGAETWVVYGTHYSAGFSEAAGMVSALCVDEANYWWLVSVGNVLSVPKVWREGTDETNNWTLSHKIINGQWFSIITDDTSTATAGDEVTFDCIGVETDGDGSSGAAIETPMPVLENFLANWVFNKYPDDSPDGTTWIPRALAAINTAHFDETDAFLGFRNHTCATVIYKSETGLGILEQICSDFDVFPFWSLDWTLGIRPKDPSIAAIYDGEVLAQRNGDFLDDCTKLPANPDQQLSEYEVGYHFNETEGSSMSRALVKDPGALQVRGESYELETGKSQIG